MILILLNWLYAITLSFTLGAFARKFFQRNYETKVQLQNPVWDIIIGFVTINVFVSILSFFIKIALISHISLGVLVVFIWYFQKEYLISELRYFWTTFKSWHKISISLFVILFLLVWQASVKSADNYDDSLYYQPYITWLTTYPTIKGLGNLHDRFAFNSNWHLLNAFFSFSFGLKNAFHHLNGLLFALVSYLAVEGFNNFIRNTFTKTDILKICLIIPNFILITNISSPAPDLPVTYFVLIILILFFEKINNQNLSEIDYFSLLLFTLIAYVFTIKLSAVIIGFVGIFLLFKLRNMNSKQYGLIIFMSLLIISPHIIRNVYLSGYLLFPIDKLDIFTLDWKIPPHELIETTKWIALWAQGVTYEAYNPTNFQWISAWFKKLDDFDVVILVALPIFFVFYGIGCIFYRKIYLKFLPLILITFLGITFWFFTAPAPRFNYGFLLFPIFFLLSEATNRLKNARYKYVFLVLVIFIQVFAFKGFGAIQGYVFFFPEYISNIELIDFKSCDNKIIFYRPKSGDQCFRSNLLCVPINISVELRTNDISDGFRRCLKPQ